MQSGYIHLLCNTADLLTVSSSVAIIRFEISALTRVNNS